MEAFDGELGVEPALLAFGVIADVGISHGRQFTGGVLRGVSGRVRAVDDDFGVLVGNQRGDVLHFFRRQVLGGWKMRVIVGGLRERLEQEELLAAVELRAQLIAADGLNGSVHRGLLEPLAAVYSPDYSASIL